MRNGTEGRELATARWGMPSSQHALMEATMGSDGHFVGTSPNFLMTIASLKLPVAGSPVRLNATAPT